MIPKQSNHIVDVDDVAFSYSGQERDLDHVAFHIREGEFVSLVGPSGCGKSTLLRLITGVLKPAAGSIRVNGSVVDGPVHTVGLVPQDALLFSWRNALANVRLLLEIAQMERNAAEREAWQALELVDLTSFAGKYPHQLSGGMKQRVALARALVRKTSLLLLDEPFAALDTISRAELQNELLRVREKTGAAILLVTHNLLEAIALSERVLVMGEKPGRIIDIVDIPLDYPRHAAAENFGRLVGEVTAMLAKGGLAGGI